MSFLSIYGTFLVSDSDFGQFQRTRSRVRVSIEHCFDRPRPTPSHPNSKTEFSNAIRKWAFLKTLVRGAGPSALFVGAHSHTVCLSDSFSNQIRIVPHDRMAEELSRASRKTTGESNRERLQLGSEVLAQPSPLCWKAHVSLSISLSPSLSLSLFLSFAAFARRVFVSLKRERGRAFNRASRSHVR